MNSAGRPGEPSRSANGRRWPLAVGVLAALGCGAGGALGWHHWHRTTEAIKRLPALPELAGAPDELRRKIDAAEIQATGHHAPEDIARLARLYHVNGFAGRARICWQILHELQPSEPRWVYYLADLCRQDADEAGYEAQLRATVRLDPGYAPAWLALGDLEFKTGQLEDADQAYRRRLDLMPRDPYAGLGLARIALELNRRDEAKRRLLGVIRDTPDFSSAHNLYAEILAQEHDLPGAANQRWLGTVAGRFRADADPWLEEMRADCYDAGQLIVWGEVDLQTKTGDRGRACLEKAVRCAPHNARAYEKLGEFYLTVGEAAKARDVMEQGRQLPDASELLYAQLCDAYRSLEQPEGALRIAELALAKIPNSAILENSRGLALVAAGRFDDALDAFRAAVALSPGAPDPAANMGLTLSRLGRTEEAKTWLQRAIDRQPAFAKATVALARMELQEGRIDLAAEHIFPYFQQFPGLGSARDLMARLYLARALAAAREGDTAAVERLCREGLAIVPESADLYGFLGTNYENEQRFDEAIKAFEAARRLRPDDLRVMLSLGELYHRMGRDDDARRLLVEGQSLAEQRANREAASLFAQALNRLAP